jgi:predicted XRE-type DNA-binding protein
MIEAKKRALLAAGFVCGDAEDLLQLTDEERKLVELRLAVSRAVRTRRKESNLTQTQVARKLKTSQPRSAKIESASFDVSLDSMFRGLFAIGGSMDDVTLAN